MSERTVNLLEHIPQFMREYAEMREILQAENPEFQLLADEGSRTKDNLFILTCDEDGISRFESMLNISPNPDDSLQARISRVITRWNDALPYTYRSLIQKLTVLCGEGNFEILPNFNDYEMEVVTYLPLAGQVNELDYLLKYIVPANILVTSTNLLSKNITGHIYTGGGTVTHWQWVIDSKTNTEHSLESSLIQAGTVVKMKKVTINTQE